ncbi:MAG: hypothetical protein ABIH67_01200 [Candidatus Uhrbacteria bacterium]
MFNEDEIACLFDSGQDFDPLSLLDEARRRGQPEEIKLNGVYFGGDRINAGRLVFIQRGLVLFVGDGMHSGDRVPEFQVFSGIARYSGSPHFCLFIERFRSGTHMMSLSVAMDQVGDRPRTQHLRGLAGYLDLKMGQYGDIYHFVGFEEAIWRKIIQKLDEYLIPH